ncbi:hypothetical protein WN51_05182 [Melipona quadrifasciata]|uniref:Uncharacterized protein n=1 Tax=Melipona quadrifasciata TaxID=166423 RepID=A0A0M8ZRR8_9HYME|nr:hypothetical protein WN51_05182 [Melipona quadrifasciata]
MAPTFVLKYTVATEELYNFNNETKDSNSMELLKRTFEDRTVNVVNENSQSTDDKIMFLRIYGHGVIYSFHKQTFKKRHLLGKTIKKFQKIPEISLQLKNHTACLLIYPQKIDSHTLILTPAKEIEGNPENRASSGATFNATKVILARVIQKIGPLQVQRLMQRKLAIDIILEEFIADILENIFEELRRHCRMEFYQKKRKKKKRNTVNQKRKEVSPQMEEEKRKRVDEAWKTSDVDPRNENNTMNRRHYRDNVSVEGTKPDDSTVETRFNPTSSLYKDHRLAFAGKPSVITPALATSSFPLKLAPLVKDRQFDNRSRFGLNDRSVTIAFRNSGEGTYSTMYQKRRETCAVYLFPTQLASQLRKPSFEENTIIEATIGFAAEYFFTRTAGASNGLLYGESLWKPIKYYNLSVEIEPNLAPCTLTSNVKLKGLLRAISRHN